MVIQMKENQSSREAFGPFLLLSAAFENHQTASGWQGSKNGIFLFIILTQIAFNSFSYFISHCKPKTLFTVPLFITVWGLCGGPPFPIDLGPEINKEI